MQYGNPPSPKTASHVYALSQGQDCEGPERCHWCCGPCQPRWIHDDDPPVPFLRTRSTARNPAGRFVCVGCWLWRRRSVTVFHFGRRGGLKDRQKASDWSWWITDREAKVIPAVALPELWPLILKPPAVFVLMLLDGEKIENHIQLACPNYVPTVAADTPLRFTVNNVPHEYTIYDVEQAAGGGPQAPGAAALLRLLGPVPEELITPPKQRKVGKPGILGVREVQQGGPQRVVRSGT